MITNLGRTSQKAVAQGTASASNRVAEDRLLKADHNDSQQKAQIVMGKVNFRSKDEARATDEAAPSERLALSRPIEQQEAAGENAEKTSPPKNEDVSAEPPVQEQSEPASHPGFHRSPLEQAALMRERQSEMLEVNKIYTQMAEENKKTMMEIHALIMQTNNDIMAILRGIWEARVKASQDHMRNVTYLITEQWPQS